MIRLALWLSPMFMISTSSEENFLCEVLVKLSLSSHSETYEAVFKWKLIRLTFAPDKEGRILNLKESSFCKLMYIVFFHMVFVSFLLTGSRSRPI